MLQRVFGRGHQGPGPCLEISIERFVHAAEQSRRHLRATELAILDGIDPGVHPPAPDEGLVRFVLVVGGALHCSVVQPDVRDLEPGEHTARRRLLGDPEQDGLAIERLLFTGGQCALGDQVSDPEEFAAAPDAGGGVEGHCFLARLAISAFPRFAAGDDHPLVVPDIHLLQLPDLSFAKAVAGLIFETQGVVLGGEDASATIVVRVFRLVVHRQNRHG